MSKKRMLRRTILSVLAIGSGLGAWLGGGAIIEGWLRVAQGGEVLPAPVPARPPAAAPPAAEAESSAPGSPSATTPAAELQATSAQDASAQADRIDGLILDLGSSSFQKREAATSELLQIGIEALPALSEARPESDPEVRKRIQMISERLAAGDLEARIDAFLSGRAGASLPGWDYARGKLGDKPVLRELFVQITRQHPQLAASLEGSPRERTMALQQASARINAGFMDVATIPSVADALGLLLAVVDEDTPPSEAVDATLLRLFSLGDTTNAFQDAELARPLKDLIGQWLPRVTKPGRPRAMFFSMQWDFEEGLLLAATTIRETEDVETLEFALQTVARFGSPSDALMLKPLLDDKRPAGFASLGPAGREMRVQLGDVAMAAIGVINDRKLRDLGFPEAEMHPQVGFSVETLGFPVGPEGDAARQRVREEIDELVQAVERLEDIVPQPPIRRR